MKAIADDYDGARRRPCWRSPPAATACSICSGDHDAQAAALEALVHAVEDERLPLDARRGRARRGSAARRSGSSRRPWRPRPLGGAALRQAARPRRASRDRRRDGAVRVMLKPRALEPGRSHRRRRARQPLRARRVRRGRRRAPRASASSRSTTSRCSRGSAYVAGIRRASRGRRSARRGAIRRSRAVIAVRGGYGSVQLLPLLDRGRGPAGAQGVHRLQRHHVAAHVAHARLRRRGVSRTDARRAAGARRRRVRPRVVHRARCAGRSRWASSRRAGARGDLRTARRRACLLGGTLTQLLASLGTPYAFDPPPGCVLFLETSASGRTGSIAW